MDWTQIIIAAVGLLFTCVITPAVAALFKWLMSKTDNEKLLTAITEAQTVADNVVASLQQNVVEGIKTANADGKLTQDDIEKIMTNAIGMFTADISSGALQIIKDNADDATIWIKNLIESRLLKLKNEG